MAFFRGTGTTQLFGNPKTKTMPETKTGVRILQFQHCMGFFFFIATLLYMSRSEIAEEGCGYEA